MPATKEKVMTMVQKTIKKNPDVPNKELYKKAIKIDSSIKDLSLRQFHARYPLQVKREMAQKSRSRSTGKRGARKKRGGGDGTPRIDRAQVRATLLKFAKDVSAVEGKAEMIDLLTSVDDYVDEVVKALDKRG